MPSPHLLCEVGDNILIELPHLQRGVLATLLAKRLHYVAIYVGG